VKGTAVGAVFLAATWALVLRNRDTDARAWGLALGGLLEVPAASLKTTVRDALVAMAWAFGLALLIFPAFVIGFGRYNKVHSLAWVPPPHGFADLALGQLVVIALPEEAFFRGYLQTALDRALPGRVRVLGADVGFAIVLASAIFALGHLATISNPARLAVFFPSLVFGWLRARTKGIGAGVLFHAMCNLLSDGLERGAGMHS
jgi:membrane protease YdiL (CAAX protease family)